MLRLFREQAGPKFLRVTSLFMVVGATALGCSVLVLALDPSALAFTALVLVLWVVGVCLLRTYTRRLVAALVDN